MGLPGRRPHLLQRADRQRELPAYRRAAEQRREPGGAARLRASARHRGHRERGRDALGSAPERAARHPGRHAPVQRGDPGRRRADLRGRLRPPASPGCRACRSRSGRTTTLEVNDDGSPQSVLVAGPVSGVRPETSSCWPEAGFAGQDDNWSLVTVGTLTPASRPGNRRRSTRASRSRRRLGADTSRRHPARHLPRRTCRDRRYDGRQGRRSLAGATSAVASGPATTAQVHGLPADAPDRGGGAVDNQARGRRPAVERDRRRLHGAAVGGGPGDLTRRHGPVRLRRRRRPPSPSWPASPRCSGRSPTRASSRRTRRTRPTSSSRTPQLALTLATPGRRVLTTARAGHPERSPSGTASGTWARSSGSRRRP